MGSLRLQLRRDRVFERRRVGRNIFQSCCFYDGSVPRFSSSLAKRVSASFTDAFSSVQRLQSATVLALSSFNRTHVETRDESQVALRALSALVPVAQRDAEI